MNRPQTRAVMETNPTRDRKARVFPDDIMFYSVLEKTQKYGFFMEEIRVLCLKKGRGVKMYTSDLYKTQWYMDAI